jgi:hypothetical protein
MVFLPYKKKMSGGVLLPGVTFWLPGYGSTYSPRSACKPLFVMRYFFNVKLGKTKRSLELK